MENLSIKSYDEIIESVKDAYIKSSPEERSKIITAISGIAAFGLLLSFLQSIK